MFSDDGHPDLAEAVLDLTGDQRDEIVLWDEKRVWIYTQDRPFAGKRIYAPGSKSRLQRFQLPDRRIPARLARGEAEAVTTSRS